EHRGGDIQTDDVVTVLSDRDRDPSGAAAQLEGRRAGPPGQPAESLDVRAALEWRHTEVVQRREPRGLCGFALGAQPVTRLGRHDQSPAPPQTRSRLIDPLTAQPLVAR